jgi:hypothetical protein
VKRSLAVFALASVFAATPLLFAGCGSQPAAGIVLALQTDLVVPDDISAVALVIADDKTGKIIGDPILRATAPSKDGNTVRFPSTLNLLTAFDAATFSADKRGARIVETIRVTLVGLRGKTLGADRLDSSALESRDARVLRRIVASMPEDGMHLLRVNLGALDLDTVGPIEERGGSSRPPTGRDVMTNYALLRSKCTIGEDRVGGVCKPITVINGDVLPLFAAADVFGGAETPENGACFDLARCFNPANRVVKKLEVTLGKDGCTAPLPTELGAAPNLAYERTDSETFSNGASDACIADKNGRHCLFRAPADGAGGFGEDGYSVKDGRLILPLGVCRALDVRKIDGLWGSASEGSAPFETGCPKLTEKTPVCSSASAKGTPSTSGVADAGDAGDQAFVYPFQGDFMAVCIAYGLPAGLQPLPDGGVGDPGIPIRFKATAKYAPVGDGSHALDVTFVSLEDGAGTIEKTFDNKNETHAVIDARGEGTAVATNLLIPNGAFKIPNPDAPKNVDVGGESADFALKIKNNARFCANLTIKKPYYSVGGVVVGYDGGVAGPCFFEGPYDVTYPLKTHANGDITCP